MYALRLRGLVLGHSALELTDPATRTAGGVFRPTAEYERVRSVFRLRASALAEAGAAPIDEEAVARYAAARDALGIELVDGGGRVLATAAIDVDDRGNDDELEIEVAIDDPRFWASLRDGL